MGTKSGKSQAGKDNEYLTNAAKSIPWPMDVKDRRVDVPQDHLEDAEEHMILSYLRKNYGVRVASVIPGSVTVKSDFKPKYRDRIDLPETSKGNERAYPNGTEFKVASTGVRLKVEQYIPGDKNYKLAYVGQMKEPILYKEVHIKKMITLKAWEQI